MRFEKNGYTWQAIDETKRGVIAVIVVDGRRTNRRGWFPYPQQDMMNSEPSLPDELFENIPF